MLKVISAYADMFENGTSRELGLEAIHVTLTD